MKSLEKLFDIIGEILAVVLVITWAVLILNANFGFLDEVPVLYNILSVIRNYGGLVLIAVVGLEAISKRNIIFKIILHCSRSSWFSSSSLKRTASSFRCFPYNGRKIISANRGGGFLKAAAFA